MPLVMPGISDQQLAALKASGVPAIITPNASAFEGASTSRRMRQWGTSGVGPNSAITGSLSNLRNRSHEFTRNHPLAQNAVDVWVSNMVGTGIVPRWRVNGVITPELKEWLQKRFLRWTDEADAAGLCDFYGQQALGARTVVESGEVLIRRRNRANSDGMHVPLQLQVMEPDHLPHAMTQAATNGNEIQAAIEFDWIGRRAAYHVHRRHPGDQFYNADTGTVRVPASDMIHAFRPLRPGQNRGVPWMSAIVTSLYELDQYTDAERVRKKIAAMFGAFITSPDGGGGDGNDIGTSLGNDIEGRVLAGLEPGIIRYLDRGEDIKFAAPADIGGNTSAWLQQQLREVAVGVGLTYEQLTGDLSNVNYSSLRAGLVEFRRRCEALIFHIMVFQICRPIAGWWMDALYRSGAIDLPDYWQNRSEYLDIEWYGQGWEYINPVDDRIAEQMDIRNGLNSRQSVVANRRGRDVEEVDKEIAEDNKRADDLGLVLDSDPRQITGNGAIQAATIAAIEGRGNE